MRRTPVPDAVATPPGSQARATADPRSGPAAIDGLSRISGLVVSANWFEQVDVGNDERWTVCKHWLWSSFGPIDVGLISPVGMIANVESGSFRMGNWSIP